MKHAVVDDERLVERGPGIWSLCEPFKLLGASFGRRMVIVSRNGLTGVFSPNQDLKRTMDTAFGESFQVDCLIAPTAFHDTYFAEAVSSYPDAKRLVSAAFPSGVDDTAEIHQSWPDAWKETLIPFAIDGMPKIQETVFFDKETSTLVVSDLFFNFDENWDLWTKTFTRMVGAFGEARMSRLFRLCIKDKKALKKSMEPLLELPVENILPSHGKVVLGSGRSVLLGLYERV